MQNFEQKSLVRTEVTAVTISHDGLLPHFHYWIAHHLNHGLARIKDYGWTARLRDTQSVKSAQSEKSVIQTGAGDPYPNAQRMGDGWQRTRGTPWKLDNLR